MMLSLSFESLLALVTLIAQAGTSIASRANSVMLLDEAAKAAGKLYFGTATDNPELSNAAYVKILNDSAIFGQLTPGNSMKWDATEPEQSVFNFTLGDEIASLAKATGKMLRGHNLVWHNQVPDWVVYGSWTPETLTSAIETHVRTEVSHYAGQIYAWDVVNEPLTDDGIMRTDVFYNHLGSSYIKIALQTAHNADPNAKLYINEYNLEYAGPKIDAMVKLVENLKAANIPIHGIGFECHLIVGQVSASELLTNMERITALGLEVAVTELDVRIRLPATKADLEQQRADYMSVVQVCKRVSRCVGVTVWDYTDKFSWIPAFFPGFGKACPWDANLMPKPAYDGIVRGFLNHV